MECDNKQNIEWRPVIGFEAYYEVSNTGLVRSIKTGRLRKQGIGTTGYYVISAHVKVDGNIINKILKVHRLVAQAFIPNPDNKPVIDHIDGNPLNNDVSNLRWATAKENANNPITVARLIKAIHDPIVVAKRKAAMSKQTYIDKQIEKYKQRMARDGWEEHRNKMLEGLRAKNNKPVYCVEQNIAYPSIQAAAVANNLLPTTVGAACKKWEEHGKLRLSWSGKGVLHFYKITKEQYEELAKKQQNK